MKYSKNFLQLIVVISFLVLCIGCQRNDNPTSTNLSLPLVPLKVGSQWVYRNTSYDTLGNAQEIFLDTVRIYSDTTIDSQKWYLIEPGLTFFANKRNDFWVMTIYTNERFAYTQSCIAKYPAELMDYWPIPLGIQVQLYAIGSNLSVPSGQYSYYQYSYTDTVKHVLMQYKYFSPGTGLIREESYFQSGSMKNSLMKKRELVVFKE